MPAAHGWRGTRFVRGHAWPNRPPERPMTAGYPPIRKSTTGIRLRSRVGLPASLAHRSSTWRLCPSPRDGASPFSKKRDSPAQASCAPYWPGALPQASVGVPALSQGHRRVRGSSARASWGNPMAPWMYQTGMGSKQRGEVARISAPIATRGSIEGMHARRRVAKKMPLLADTKPRTMPLKE
jgi:hypothetical protein